MLGDTPRKLLLILTHYSKHFGRMPAMPELERLSGRMPVDIRNGLKKLSEENYIDWNPHTPPETAIIIEGWERPDPRFIRHDTASQEMQQGVSSSIDYWTRY